VTRYQSTGTHEGEFQGVAATGRKTEISEVSIHRVLNGKIVEQWGFPDGLSHMQQLTEEQNT
jgi:predicted ester cyclase